MRLVVALVGYFLIGAVILVVTGLAPERDANGVIPVWWGLVAIGLGWLALWAFVRLRDLARSSALGPRRD